MQLCHIHFYQKIARKKVARVNAALHLKNPKRSTRKTQTWEILKGSLLMFFVLLTKNLY